MHSLITDAALGLACAVVGFPLWSMVVSVLLRAFGLQLPLVPWWESDGKKAVLAQLTARQHVLMEGALRFGGGLLVAATMMEYFRYKYWGDVTARPSVTKFVLNFVLFSAIGSCVAYSARRNLLSNTKGR